VSDLRDVSGAPQDLWRAAVARDPARPFLTHYDDATGERVELSFTTTDNWVAKTANLLVDELCAEPGERVGLWLPTHWQTVVWYLACWATGTVPALGADPADCAHAVADPEHAEATVDCPGTRLLVPLRPLGGRAATVPTGMLDYAAEVPTHGDRFAGPPVLATAPALERAGVTLDGAALVAAARADATEHGLSGASRVLFTGDLGSAAGLAAGLLGPLAAGASVVLCRNVDRTRLPDRAQAERVTHQLS
jgi:uncharacterized protein (TIGR03089 family)